MISFIATEFSAYLPAFLASNEIGMIMEVVQNGQEKDLGYNPLSIVLSKHDPSAEIKFEGTVPREWLTDLGDSPVWDGWFGQTKASSGWFG